MKASEKCIDLIKSFEKFEPKTYLDQGRRPTIGYGHLLKKGESFGTITESDAMKLLCKDLDNVEACIDKHVDVDLTQGQFDALCMFVFNVGAQNFYDSTLRSLVNNKHFEAAAEEFPKWKYVTDRGTGKKFVSQGLINRRIKERELFLT